jgi:hypothetical protein
MCSNRLCPCCWCPYSQLDETDKNCKYRQAAEIFAQVDVTRDDLLDDDENVLRGKGGFITQAERRLKHKLRPLNTWRLILLFELFMSCCKS